MLIAQEKLHAVGLIPAILPNSGILVHESCVDHFLETWDFAEKHGILFPSPNRNIRSLCDALIQRHDYAAGEGCTYDRTTGADTKCILFNDRTKYNFEFLQLKKQQEWVNWFNGGLIYQGPSAEEAFTVSLTSYIGWGSHT